MNIPDAGLLVKDTPQRSCTSLFLSAADGTRVFGTNLDYQFSRGRLYVNPRGVTKQGWSYGTTGAVASWTSKYGNLTFNLAGYQLAWAGMNEAGLVISTMALDSTVNPRADSRPPLESGFWVQYVLDSCATVNEVRQTDKKVRMARTVDHYLLCDRSGGCAVIEFLNGRMVCHWGETFPSVRSLTTSTNSRWLPGGPENHSKGIHWSALVRPQTEQSKYTAWRSRGIRIFLSLRSATRMDGLVHCVRRAKFAGVLFHRRPPQPQECQFRRAVEPK